MSYLKQLFLVLLILLVSSVALAATCTVNGQAVECPQISNEVIFIGAGIFFLIILVIFAFVAFSFFKTWSTGSVSVTLPKSAFTGGETITGNMGITLKKPVEVASGIVELYGERTKQVYRGGERHTETEIFFKTGATIQTLPTYQIGSSQAAFAIQIPLDILNKGKFDASALGAIGGAINFIQDVAMPKPRWFVSVELKTKDNITLSNRTQIQIG